MKRKAGISVISLLLAGWLLLTCATSCSRTAKKVSARELSASYTSEIQNTVPLTEEFKNAMADFAFNLFGTALEEQDEKTNKLISPLSAALCLALVANGAEGETLTQMEDAFGVSLDSLNEGLLAYVRSLPESEEVNVDLANSVWIRDDEKLTVNESYLQQVVNWYTAQIYTSEFDERFVQDVNNWCYNHTDGMIRDILEDVPEEAMMFLVNALLFDAAWKEPYEKDQVLEGVFTNGDGSRTDVNYLSSEESVYLEGYGLTGVAKAYKGSGFYFVGLLPDDADADIYEVAQSLSGSDWMNLWNGRTYGPVITKIPEFTSQDQTNLKGILNSMGMQKMLTDDAEFLPMGNYDGYSLHVSDVQQKTYIDVNRNGTRAAAVTWAEMDKATAYMPEETRYVSLDRPFLYLIVDAESGLPLFIGAVDSLAE